MLQSLDFHTVYWKKDCRIADPMAEQLFCNPRSIHCNTNCRAGTPSYRSLEWLLGILTITEFSWTLFKKMQELASKFKKIILRTPNSYVITVITIPVWMILPCCAISFVTFCNNNFWRWILLHLWKYEYSLTKRICLLVWELEGYGGPYHGVFCSEDENKGKK